MRPFAGFPRIAPPRLPAGSRHSPRLVPTALLGAGKGPWAPAGTGAGRDPGFLTLTGAAGPRNADMPAGHQRLLRMARVQA
ncbi:hypothetical protein GCM10010168_57500 [Actinoplanes ianthinogenes]|uniref:Uncharacterized protein n=1 Tax=Actinoplanes ianthinogenes TaxID=122358 RepID=A0ABM7M2U9_9ACTN|nr:hypothetical protein Aiant_64870 [Actinoplanes ianthinogenes]GGR31732.1 hypothetical protein GCM10010168_57500 [Actinoplanes ianthinogenes]